MRSSRRVDDRAAARSERADAAARRLALLATDLGADPPAAEGDRPADRVAAPVLPRPGRHAARRRGGAAALTGRLPVIGPSQLAALAVIVAAGLAVTTWWVVRDRAEPVPVTAAPPATVDPLVPAGTEEPHPTAAATDPAEGSVTVDVTGKVRRPGIVVLDAGARVVDALEAAGGARPGVDLSGLNLARVLVDGEQVVVGVPAAAVPLPPGGTPSSGAPVGLVNLNTASVAELETLPEVGPVTAQAIVTWREQNGGFTSVDELLAVDGIGELTLEKLAPYVTV